MRTWILKVAHTNFLRLALITLLPILYLTGCATLSDPESSQEFNSHQIGFLNPDNSYGQVIGTRHSLVNGITLWFSQADQDVNPIPGHVKITVYDNQTNDTAIYSTSISTSPITQLTPIKISFAPQPILKSNSFYIELSTTDTELVVHGRLEDNYSGGQAYQNRKPINADLAFRVTYNYDMQEFWLDMQQLASNIKPILQIIIIILLPGYAIIRLLHFNKIYSATEQLALAAGFSLAIIPMIYMFGSKLDIPINLPAIQFLGIVFVVIVLIMCLIDRSYRILIQRIQKPKNINQKNRGHGTVPHYVIFLLLIAIVTIAFIVRVILIRDLATPAWVDSIHHGLITRLIMENGQYPQSYLPYLDIGSSNYHPGFHSILATFLFVSDMDFNQGMLLLGQALNAITALSVYLLAVTITRKNTAGLMAALIGSTFMAMPAYYTSWGRYPQLAGLIILPLPLTLLKSIVESPPSKWQKLNLMLGAGIALTGLTIVHYRVAAFAVCLLLSWFIAETIFSFRRSKKMIVLNFISLLVLGLLTFTLASPWLMPLLRETIIPQFSPNQNVASSQFFGDFSWHYLTPLFGKQIMALAAVGLTWASIKKHKISIVMIGWIILLFFLANLDAMNLPGGRFVNNSSVAIMLFMPFSVIVGYLLDQFWGLWKSILNNRCRILFASNMMLVLLTLTVLGSRQIIAILNPTTLLSRQADLIAIQWIDKNIPDDKTILINSFSWGYGLYAGSDGGAWISALAGNQTIPPPVIYGLGSTTTITSINNICQEVSRLGSSPDELWDYITNYDIEYIYTGSRGGSISPTLLAENSHFEVLYNQNNTWLFRILRSNP